MKLSNTFVFAVVLLAMASYSNIKSGETELIKDKVANQGILARMTGPNAQCFARAASNLPLMYVVSQVMTKHPVSAFALACASATSVLSEATPRSQFSDDLNKTTIAASALTLASNCRLWNTTALLGAVTNPATSLPMIGTAFFYGASKLETEKINPSYREQLNTLASILFKIFAAYTAFVLITKTA